jgi:hypothetical protein
VSQAQSRLTKRWQAWKRLWLTAQDGKLVPQPIEDEANVDARRKELGMPPLADYLKMVNEQRGVPVPLPTPEKKMQKS